MVNAILIVSKGKRGRKSYKVVLEDQGKVRTALEGLSLGTYLAAPQMIWGCRVGR